MDRDNISNSDMVEVLRRFVDGYSSQREAARALGNKGLQSSISNALAGVRMPSKGLLRAMETKGLICRGEQLVIVDGAPESQCFTEMSVMMTFTRETKNTFRYDAETDFAVMANCYLLKSQWAVDPPQIIEVIVKAVVA